MHNAWMLSGQPLSCHVFNSWVIYVRNSASMPIFSLNARGEQTVRYRSVFCLLEPFGKCIQKVVANHFELYYILIYVA